MGPSHLPSWAGGFIISILVLHGSVYFTNGQTATRASQDSAAKNDREGMLRSSICVGQTSQGVWTVLMRLMPIEFLDVTSGLWLFWLVYDIFNYRGGHVDSGRENFRV